MKKIRLVLGIVLVLCFVSITEAGEVEKGIRVGDIPGIVYDKAVDFYHWVFGKDEESSKKPEYIVVKVPYRNPDYKDGVHFYGQFVVDNNSFSPRDKLLIRASKNETLTKEDLEAAGIITPKTKAEKDAKIINILDRELNPSSYNFPNLRNESGEWFYHRSADSYDLDIIRYRNIWKNIQTGETIDSWNYNFPGGFLKKGWEKYPFSAVYYDLGYFPISYTDYIKNSDNQTIQNLYKEIEKRKIQAEKYEKERKRKIEETKLTPEEYMLKLGYPFKYAKLASKAGVSCSHCYHPGESMVDINKKIYKYLHPRTQIRTDVYCFVSTSSECQEEQKELKKKLRKIRADKSLEPFEYYEVEEREKRFTREYHKGEKYRTVFLKDLTYHRAPEIEVGYSYRKGFYGALLPKDVYPAEILEDRIPSSEVFEKWERK